MGEGEEKDKRRRNNASSTSSRKKDGGNASATQTNDSENVSQPTHASSEGEVRGRSMDQLEKNFNEKLEKQNEQFNSINERLNKMFELFSARENMAPTVAGQHSSRVTDEANCAARRPLIPLEPNLSEDNDVLSVTISRSEIRNSGLLSELESGSGDKKTGSVCPSIAGDTDGDRFQRCVTVPKDTNLLEVFGEDARTGRSKSSEGLILDESQINILKESWRSKHPDKISCYKDSYRTCFPVHEKSEEVLKVPQIDETVESLLIKKYGQKAGFGSSPSLFGRSMKSIEKLAFHGQLAARMGIITACYAQQALSALLISLKEEEPNIDRAIQTVRDIFAITTKNLDQVARAGAFHHLIRRRAAVNDTGLSDFKGYASTVLTLPLSAEGVFGTEFDEKLKSKQEKNKQIADVLPELGDKAKTQTASNKRKFSSENSSEKRQKLDDNKYNYSTPKRFLSQSYRIPRVGGNQNNRGKAYTQSRHSDDARTYKR